MQNIRCNRFRAMIIPKENGTPEKFLTVIRMPVMINPPRRMEFIKNF
jgi:hypothetical protein